MINRKVTKDFVKTWLDDLATEGPPAIDYLRRALLIAAATYGSATLANALLTFVCINQPDGIKLLGCPAEPSDTPIIDLLEDYLEWLDSVERVAYTSAFDEAVATKPRAWFEKPVARTRGQSASRASRTASSKAKRVGS